MEAPPLHVLLIESSAGARTAIRFQLEQLGHTVEAAGSAAELQPLADGTAFNVVLVDANSDLPALRPVQERSAMIGLLSQLDPADVRTRFKTVLVKPFTQQQLADALSAVQIPDEQTPLVQRADLLARLGGNRDVLPQMTELLQKQAESWRAEMGSAVAQRDGEMLRRLAHQAKGTLANLAAPPAAVAAQEVEELARAGQWERAEDGIAKFEAAVEQVVRELAAM
jgi:CheY-like chemotaxis protein